MQTDEALMASLAEGDLGPLGILVERHQDWMLSLAFRLLGQWDAAEDAVQEAFLRVHRAAPKYRPTAQFKTWLYRLVVNLCFDARRRGKRRPVQHADFSTIPAPDDSPGALASEETVEIVRKAVDGLPDRQRTTLILHRYEGLSHKRIAEITGWSESAVESLLVRAYDSLRRKLSGLKET